MAGRVTPEWVKRMNRGKHKGVGLKHGFRSGLEHKVAEQLKAAGIPAVYEEIKVNYIIPESRHYYLADFALLGNNIIVETKGIFDATDRAKHVLIKAQYPDLDIRFVFSRSKAPINPGSKTTLAQWCEARGFKYADKLIPEGWFSEPGPERTIADVLAGGPYGYMDR